MQNQGLQGRYELRLEAIADRCRTNYEVFEDVGHAGLGPEDSKQLALVTE